MSLFSKKPGDAVQGGQGRSGGYGIAEAVQLMRTLPVDQNVELVVRVIRNTLESMNVQVPAIIEDAEARERGLKDRMDTLNVEIADFTREIEKRRQEIAAVEADLSETTTVKERLLLAQGFGERAAASLPGSPPPLPAAVTTRPNGRAIVAAEAR